MSDQFTFLLLLGILLAAAFSQRSKGTSSSKWRIAMYVGFLLGWVFMLLAAYGMGQHLPSDTPAEAKYVMSVDLRNIAFVAIGLCFCLLTGASSLKDSRHRAA